MSHQKPCHKRQERVDNCTVVFQERVGGLPTVESQGKLCRIPVVRISVYVSSGYHRISVVTQGRAVGSQTVVPQGRMGMASLVVSQGRVIGLCYKI